MTRANVQPKQILTAIRQEDPNTYIAASDIRNERKVVRADRLNSRTPVECMLDELSSSPEWIFDVKLNSEKQNQNFFFTYEKQVELLLANPDVLLMDCTYKTNRYGLPLLHIIGCTNLQTYISAGYCFLRNETFEDYYWALSTFVHRTGVSYPRVFISDQEEALKSAAGELLRGVPQLLCVWHVNKNVLTRAQHTWRDADGKTTEQKSEIAEKRKDFMGQWNLVSSVDLCSYLTDYQYPNRKEWATAWTSQHRHYGTITTSPAEGMHKVLKDYIQTSRGDLLRVVDCLKEKSLNQYIEYRKNIGNAKHTRKHEHSTQALPFLPKNVHYVVTPPSIEIVKKKYELYKENFRKNNNSFCTGNFGKLYGLPCWHKLRFIIATKTQLSLEHFDDDHWRYDRRHGPWLHFEAN